MTIGGEHVNVGHGVNIPSFPPSAGTVRRYVFLAPFGVLGPYGMSEFLALLEGMVQPRTGSSIVVGSSATALRGDIPHFQ